MSEALGAFVIVVVGCGAIVATHSAGETATATVAAAFGAAVAIGVYALAHISGAHFNPAVTVGFAVVGRFPWKRVPSYIAAQAAGATLGAIVLFWTSGSLLDLGVTSVAPGVSTDQALALEVVFTFLLAFVIAGVATDDRAPKGAAGLAIGLAVTLGSLVAGPSTGASMNPARSFGPAVVSGQWADFWIYIAGPVIGGLLGFALYEKLRHSAPPRVAPAAGGGEAGALRDAVAVEGG